MNSPARPWHSIQINITYGYDLQRNPLEIYCHNNGELHFQVDESLPFGLSNADMQTEEYELSKKALLQLDHLITQITDLESLEPMDQVMDGPSFSCYIHLHNGLVKGFHYTSAHLSQQLNEIEEKLRAVMKEEVYLKLCRDSIT